ncbi:MAG: hypothetical protein ACLQU5_15550 [Isosphaeraceae bacterium]
MPKTGLTTDIAGNILVVETTTKGVEAKVTSPVQYRSVSALEAEISGEYRTKSSVTYEKLPPKELLRTAGTAEHGHTVFFQLVPSNQHTLKGMKEFCLLLRVPFYWRGDLVEIDCRARTYDRGIFFTSEELAGKKKFDIILCIANDNEAETALFWLRGTEMSLLKENQDLDTAELYRGFLDYWVVMLGLKRNGMIAPGAEEAVRLTQKDFEAGTRDPVQVAEDFMSCHTLPDGSKARFSKNVLIYTYGTIIAKRLEQHFISSQKVVDGKISISYPDGTSFVVSKDVLTPTTPASAHPLLMAQTMHFVKVLFRRLSLYCERYPESPVFKATPMSFLPGLD